MVLYKGTEICSRGYFNHIGSARLDLWISAKYWFDIVKSSISATAQSMTVVVTWNLCIMLEWRSELVDRAANHLHVAKRKVS